jgi:hypothetical protein
VSIVLCQCQKRPSNSVKRDLPSVLIVFMYWGTDFPEFLAGDNREGGPGYGTNSEKVPIYSELM